MKTESQTTEAEETLVLEGRIVAVGDGRCGPEVLLDTGGGGQSRLRIPKHMVPFFGRHLYELVRFELRIDREQS